VFEYFKFWRRTFDLIIRHVIKVPEVFVASQHFPDALAIAFFVLNSGCYSIVNGVWIFGIIVTKLA
jgi:hypothetical protein